MRIPIDLDTVKSWIKWSEQKLHGSVEIPHIRSQEEWPWREAVQDAFFELGPGPDQESRKQLLDYFINELTPALSNTAARFTALQFYFSLANCAPIYAEDFEVGARSAIIEDFTLLVRSLPVEECPQEWRIIRWEILNSYAIHDWNRALELYDLAEHLQLIEPTTLHLIRGQFKFLRVVGPKIDNEFELLDWDPKLPGPIDKFRLLLFGLSPLYPELIFEASETRLLREAKNDFEGALNHGDEKLQPYQSILGGCYFLTGHFHDAVSQYQQVLDNLHESSQRGMLGGLLYKSIAKCYAKAGEEQKAIETLERCESEFPNDPDILVQLADLKATKSDFQGAYENLRSAVHLDPKREKDLGIRIALAIGGVPKDSEEIAKIAEELLKSNPEVSSLIDSLLNANWHSFAAMEEDSKKEWRFAITLMYYFPHMEPSQNNSCLESAVKNFAKAVELELLRKVFEEFREFERSDQELHALSKKSLEVDEPKEFATFLLENRLLTLGQMNYILNHLQQAEIPLFQKFEQWVQKQFPGLLKQKDNLKKLTGQRNAAVHQSKPTNKAEDVQRWCREIIDSLAHVFPHQ